MEIWQMNFWEIFVTGGPVMVPLILCLLFAFTIIIEKLIILQKAEKDSSNIARDVFQMINDNKIKDALILCEENRSPAAKILAAGLLKFGSSREEIREALENAIQLEAPKLEERLAALSTIAQISPLLGLLGTVLGMAACLHTIQVQTAAMKSVTPADLSGGIWEALLTTITGLVIAIIAYTVYNYLISRVNKIIFRMEKNATDLLSRLSQL